MYTFAQPNEIFLCYSWKQFFCFLKHSWKPATPVAAKSLSVASLSSDLPAEGKYYWKKFLFRQVLP